LEEAISIRRELTDGQWQRIEKLVPGKKGDKDRACEYNRVFVDLRTGSPWRDLADEFGKWNKPYTRFLRWAREGRWESLFKAFADEFDATSAVD
jgi:transposase